MKPRMRNQKNNQEYLKYKRIDNEMENKIKQTITIKIEDSDEDISIKHSPHTVKKEYIHMEYGDDCPDAYFESEQAFNPRGVTRTYERKNRSCLNKIVVDSDYQHMLKGDRLPKIEAMDGDKSLSKSYDAVCDNINKNFLMNRRLRSDLTPKAMLPISSGRRISSPIMSQESVTSLRAKNTVSKVPKMNIATKYSRNLPTNLLLKQEPCGELFYSENKVKDVNEADTPPFMPNDAVSGSNAPQAYANTENIHRHNHLNAKIVSPSSRVVKLESSVKRPVVEPFMDSSRKRVKYISSPSVLKSSMSSSVRSHKKTDSGVSNSSTPSRGKGKREINQLYKSLKEISWAQDKDFTTLLYTQDSVRHSGRNSSMKAASADRIKKLAKLHQSTGNSSKKSRRVSKPPQKLSKSIKRSISVKSKPHLISAYAKKRVQKSANLARGKKKKLNSRLQHCKKSYNKKNVSCPKRFVQTKKVKDKVPCQRVKSSTVKEVVPIQTAKPVQHVKKTAQKRQSQLKKNSQHVFNDENVLNENLNENKASNDPSIRKHTEFVKKKPDDSTNLRNCDLNFKNAMQRDYDVHNRRTFQENMFKGIDQKNCSFVLREVHDSISCPSSSKKSSRKKRREEESVRCSIRQSECAFRYKEIVVKKHTDYVQVVLVPNTPKQNSLTIEAIKELKDAFLAARKDPNCKAVLLNSSGSFFCSGVDLGQLYGSNKKHIAEEMATTVRDLILTLAIFPKPVVAAVNGIAVGLGVSLLTYCDIILASDKATFCIPAAKMGYLPEGGVTLTLPQVVGSSCAIEMLLHGRCLTAQQALKHGLISEILWPTQFMEGVVPRMQSLVKQSASVMETTKYMVRFHLWEKLPIQLEHEWRLLPSQWLSNECQQNIKHHLQTGWLYDY